MSHRPEKKLPLVVIMGRTNVGKSTLFNALVAKRQALVSDIAGTTRDSNLGVVEWGKGAFDLVDTAGILDEKTLHERTIGIDNIDRQAQAQAHRYLDEADLILFLVDGRDGLMSEDKALAAGLKKNDYRAKTLLVANKIDSFRLAPEAAEFHRLGLGEPFTISATNGLGTGDLLDAVIKKLSRGKKYKKVAAAEAEEIISAAIIGKPNVGKSSLLNSILGYERVIVSPVPHTTREPQNTEIIYKGQKIKLVDTAGIARHSRSAAGLEKYGVLKSLGSLDRADIALLVLDISDNLTHQDTKLVQEIVERGKSLVFILNKWDKIAVRDTKKWTRVLYDRMPFALWAPIQFISAKTGEKVNKILDLVLTMAEQRKLALSDSQCEKFMKAVIKIHKPAKGKGTRTPRLYEFRQEAYNPPVFSIRIGSNDDLHFSYVRFMENRLRQRHGFTGTPIRIKVVKDKKSHTTYND
jgi:GTP-binding protein